MLILLKQNNQKLLKYKNMRVLLRGVLMGAILLMFPAVLFAQSDTQTIEFYNSSTFEKESEIVLPEPISRLSFDIADFGVDGQAEVLIGSGVGQLPEIIFLRKDGSEIQRWLAYAENYRGGVVVDAEDIDNDGFSDVIVGTREGGGPHIRIFKSSGQLMGQFFAFDKGDRSGMTLAAGELDSNYAGKEIVVVQGEGAASLLRVFSNKGELIAEWYPFGEEFFGGLNITITPAQNILVAPSFGDSPTVKSFNGQGRFNAEFLAYYSDFPGGVDLSILHQPSGGWDVLTSPGYSGGAHIRNFGAEGRVLSPGFVAFDGEYKSGTSVASGDIDGDGLPEIAAAMETTRNAPDGAVKSIRIDLSEQKLYTYYRGVEQDSYWISSGTSQFPTPTGSFTVSRKRESTRMSWFYGEDNPNNYDLPNVPHVLTFYGPYNIHGAYWHNNFGNPMSHGCINMSLPDAEEIFAWADIGTAVEVQN